MNAIELLKCKAVVTESFPMRGWIGIVEPSEGVQKLVGLYTRAELYREVQSLMDKHGENVVRDEVFKFKVPKGYQLMFASYRDAVDGLHARRLIESHLNG